jgi:signal transduction histidine kinase
MVKGLKTIFHQMQCKVIIFQDQSEIERLQKLNNTYKRLYVASIAHDIRTPLNGIIGMLDMMSDIKTTSKAVVYVSVAKSACKLLLYLTYDITDYSQLEDKRSIG